MELIRARPPETYVMCVSKAAHALTRFSQECPSLGIKVGHGMTISVKVDLPEDEETLSSYDMAVLSAVISLFVAGNEAFTVPMVCRAMCGKLAATNLSEKIKCDVSASIRKLMTTYISINAAAQQKKYNLEQTEFNGALLNVKPMTARNDCGQECLHFKFVRPPVLYEYSLAIKHIVSFPMEAVNTATINNTHDAIVIRYCLLRRVAIILRSRRNDKIAYDTFFQEADCADACKCSKVLRSKRRKLIRHILEKLIVAGLITGYEEYKKYRSFAGVIVTVK